MKSRRNIKWLCSTLFIALFLNYYVHAQLVINELSASNLSVLIDEDGDSPDWIELTNTSNDVISLSDYYISDSPDNPFLFQLPDISIQPGEYTLLFASDKNRTGGEIYWETLVRESDNLKYIVPNSSVSDQWMDSNYNDSNWQNGTFGIGYGDNDDNTELPNGTISVFTRTNFVISDLSAVSKMLLNIDFDDAYIAYINGTEVYRENINGELPIAYNQQASSYTEPRLVFDQELPNIILDEFVDLLVEGENTLAIQLHNFNSSSSDLTLIPFLSLGYTEEPSNTKGVASETRLPLQQVNFPHLNFKLDSNGETVYLSTSTASIDSLTYPKLNGDESFGRSIIDDELYIFTTPTPGSENSIQGFSDRSSTPIISNKGGFYSNQVSISLEDPSKGEVTFFTTDGSNPTEFDEVFGDGNRIINETTTIKFRTFEPGDIPSDIIVETYFVNESHDLPVVTISTHPDNLWSDENGIYVVGTNGIPGFGYYEDGGANWNQDWEIPVHVELFETDGRKSVETGAGVKIFGAWSRNNPAKSLSIFFRSEYGSPSLNYKVFGNKDIDEFQALILRNSGNDFSSQGHSMMRDGLMTTLVNGTENDFQAYRAAVLYLNGEYWGIHNIREKVNEHFIESNSSASSDNIDLLQGGGEMDFPNGFGPIHGTIENYNELISFLTSSDLRNEDLYTQAEELIDIDNFIDYMIAQIYYANTDWPGNNIKLWRSREADGKWRWILFDTDFGFSLSYGGQAWHNTLNFALDPSGPGWPNPPWSTVIFRELVESKYFRDKYVNRMADLLNSKFQASHVHTVIDSLAGLIESEIPRHMNTSTRSGNWGGTVSGWYNQIETMKNFAIERPAHIENQLTQSMISGGKFAVGELSSINISVSNKNYGKVKVNRLEINEASWSGEYFGGVDIPITAIPKAGFEFLSWDGDVQSTERSIHIRAGDNVMATFVPASKQSDIIISEIMYNADESMESGDWIELYNSGSTSVNLAGWVLKDEDDDHEFTIPEGVVLNSNDYLVLVRDLTEFNTVYSNTENIIGELDYGFSGNSDQVRLFNTEGTLMDSVLYDDETPWPSEADGTGYSLELIDTESDNSLASNWRASIHYLGSPGLENGQSVSTFESNDEPRTLKLLQNYPNPFNPNTSITFELPNPERITLRVYSMSGQLVATLADGEFNEGSYSVKWDASIYASGVYFYELTTSSSSVSKKMVLIK